MVFPQLGYCCVRPAPERIPGRIARPAVSPAAATPRWYTTGPSRGAPAAAAVTKAESGAPDPSFRTSAATEKPPHRSIERPTLPLRIEPQRIQLPAQPGELALGQLAGGGDGALAEPGGVAGAVQVLPGLAIADGADCRQVERHGMVAQGRQRAQRTDLVEESGGKHGLEARGDARVQRIAPFGGDHQLQYPDRQPPRCRRLALPAADRTTAEAEHLQRALDALGVAGLDAGGGIGIDARQLGVHRRPAA